MISHQEIKNLAIEWALREDVIEKDYAIGWLLWGIGSEPALNDSWVFKGGTSIRKCYMETWRFTDDIEFAVQPGGPVDPEIFGPAIDRIIRKVRDESGIDFLAVPSKYRHFHRFKSVQGRVYYRGPRNAPTALRIKLDISGSEKAALPTVIRPISHGYGDSLPDPALIRCLALAEVFAEKIRAMSERGWPGDLYDIVLLYRRRYPGLAPDAIKTVLEEKSRVDKIPCPTVGSIQNPYRWDELYHDWGTILGYQVQSPPPFKEFWEEVPNIFGWLEGASEPAELPSIVEPGEEYQEWAPPSRISPWGFGIPLESIRYAAMNHLCVEIGYRKESGEYTNPLIEPYSLRLTLDGNLILHAVDIDKGEPRSYRTDRIKSVKVTRKSFRPRYKIEFSAPYDYYVE